MRQTFAEAADPSESKAAMDFRRCGNDGRSMKSASIDLSQGLTLPLKLLFTFMYFEFRNDSGGPKVTKVTLATCSRLMRINLRTVSNSAAQNAQPDNWHRLTL